MNTHNKSMRKAVLFALLLAGASALVTVGSGEVKAQPVTNPGAPALAGTALTPVGSTIVPDVLDLPLNMAEQDIRAASLVPKWSGDSDAPVVFQAPKAGTSVPVGSIVTIVLNDNGDI